MKLTVEELHKLKEAAEKTLALRQGEPKAKITVHMGDCGIAAGARDVMEALLDALGDLDRSDIQVLAAGCIDRCDHAPIVTVEMEGASPIRYAKMDPEKIRRVLEQHVLEGHVQSDLVLPDA